jgi:tRNA-specific 2-thiouridylase
MIDLNRADLDLPGDVTGTRVVVAMSGGVDSSVAAALVAGAGYETIGVTLQLYDHGEAIGRTGACCAGIDIGDARRVAERLGIAHYVLDYEARFRAAVIDDFVDGYVAGETPLPCARCNERVKFADLLDMAKDLGAAALVTGHYVASRPGPTGRTLHRAADPARDQSYFLFATTRAQLEYLRFPLGEMEKSETRRIAAELGLDIATKPDSQDICFVPRGHYSSIVRKLRPEAHAPGEIVHVDGRVLGRHDGVARFTVGQRRGLGVAAGEPLFVVAIEAASARVTVGPRAALGVRRLALRDVNWLGDGEPGAAGPLWARVRSTSEPVPARIEAGRAGTDVVLEEPEEGVSPGQACVLHDGAGPLARVLGGGWIATTAGEARALPDAAAVRVLEMAD